MLNYSPIGQTRLLGTPLNRLLQQAETGVSRSNSWRMKKIMMMTIMWITHSAKLHTHRTRTLHKPQYRQTLCWRYFKTYKCNGGNLLKKMDTYTVWPKILNINSKKTPGKVILQLVTVILQLVTVRHKRALTIGKTRVATNSLVTLSHPLRHLNEQHVQCAGLCELLACWGERGSSPYNLSRRHTRGE